MFDKIRERWKASKAEAERRIQKEMKDKEAARQERQLLGEIIRNHKYFLLKKDDDGTASQTIEQYVNDLGELSDGCHTFNELYDYRMLYNAGFFNELAKIEGNPYDIHKSMKHHDGEPCFEGGWFIVVAQLPTGQISNHYAQEFWDYFEIPEKETANEWDGHTPQEAAKRLGNFLLKQNNKLSE